MKEKFQDTSGISPYVDFVVETDHVIGQIIDAVDESGITENTLIIVTCDNGTSLSHANKGNPKIDDANFEVNVRGGKFDIFEGGHRVPFIVRWPGHIKAGSTSTEFICLTDVMATVAEIVGHQPPENSAEDSVSLLPAFEIRPFSRGRIVHHSHTGEFAIRSGDWKLAFCPGSSGRQEVPNVENLPKLQFYNLADDPREQGNVVAENPAVVSRLSKELSTIKSNGRSTNVNRFDDAAVSRARKRSGRIIQVVDGDLNAALAKAVDGDTIQCDPALQTTTSSTFVLDKQISLFG